MTHPSEPILGQFKLVFAAKPGNPAVTGKGGLSKATDSFINFFSQVRNPLLPDIFEDWPYTDGEESGVWKLKLQLKEDSTSQSEEAK